MNIFFNFGSMVWEIFLFLLFVFLLRLQVSWYLEKTVSQCSLDWIDSNCYKSCFKGCSENFACSEVHYLYCFFQPAQSLLWGMSYYLFVWLHCSHVVFCKVQLMNFRVDFQLHIFQLNDGVVSLLCVAELGVICRGTWAALSLWARLSR